MIQPHPEKHRRSIRLRGYDYSFGGFFFVTICTFKKHCSLATIANFEPHLSEVGKSVEECWRQIPKHFPKVLLDEWVIMPNHLHGIIVIRYPSKSDQAVEGPAVPIVTISEPTYEQFGRPTANSLPTVIRSFKSAVTKSVNEKFGAAKTPFWQRNYFEHIIRNQESLTNIRNYIWENPIHWRTDELFQD